MMSMQFCNHAMVIFGNARDRKMTIDQAVGNFTVIAEKDGESYQEENLKLRLSNFEIRNCIIVIQKLYEKYKLRKTQKYKIQNVRLIADFFKGRRML